MPPTPYRKIRDLKPEELEDIRQYLRAHTWWGSGLAIGKKYNLPQHTITRLRKKFNLQQCPKFYDHTPEPEGYRQWHVWAKEMAKTHNQVRCPGCGLYKIWIPKRRT